jgi:polygalacturonase
MEDVMTPLVVNCFYCCDPDGKTSYVQSKDWQPVDSRTPSIRHLSFEDITCKACHVAAAYFYGLPEQKIEQIILKNVSFDYSSNAKSDIPAMMCEIEPCSKLGLFAANIKELVMDKVTILGQEGEEYLLHGIDHMIHSD